MLDAEPSLSRVLSPAECDEALAAISRFVDLKSPYTICHSTAVAGLASGAAAALGAPEHEVTMVRRAALVARFGYLGVSNAIWDTPRPLSGSEWERVRLSPYLTERMLRRSAALAPLGRVAVQVRECLDGSGYPRGLSSASITRPARVLAAADVYQAMLERSTAPAGTHLRRGRGRAPIEVLRLIARGASNKDVAARLVISPKAAGTHIEHIYAKLGVSSRAEAGLFAVQHGLLPEAEVDLGDAVTPPT
mgnify:FL=1